MPFKIVAYLTVYCSIEKVESSPILFVEHLTYNTLAQEQHSIIYISVVFHIIIFYMIYAIRML